MINTFNTTKYHRDHTKWNSEISLYLDEINTFDSRLSEVLSQNTNDDIRAKVESFQNRFLVHRQAINDIDNAIKKHETSLSKKAKSGDHYTSSGNELEYHTSIMNNLKVEGKIFKEVKSDFLKFLSKVL